MEAHQTSIIVVGCKEVGILIAELLQELLIFQIFGKSCRCIREASAIVIHSCEIALFMGFFAEITMQIPEGFCHLCALIAFGFNDFHVGGVLTCFHELTNTFCCSFPGDHLCCLCIPGTSALGKVNTIFGIPCGNLTVFRLETGTAMELSLQDRSDFLNGFLLLKLRGNNTSGVPLIASQSEHMVNVILCKRKSEGCRTYTLRFVNEGHLLLFRGEHCHIKQCHLFSSLGLFSCV